MELLAVGRGGLARGVYLVYPLGDQDAQGAFFLGEGGLRRALYIEKQGIGLIETGKGLFGIFLLHRGHGVLDAGQGLLEERGRILVGRLSVRVPVYVFFAYGGQDRGGLVLGLVNGFGGRDRWSRLDGRRLNDGFRLGFARGASPKKENGENQGQNDF